MIQSLVFPLCSKYGTYEELTNLPISTIYNMLEYEEIKYDIEYYIMNNTSNKEDY